MMNTKRSLVFLTIGLVLGACTGQGIEGKPNATSTSAASEVLQAEESSAITPTAEPSDTPTPTNTSSPTATITPTSSPTTTPTPTPVFNLPGYYPVGKCASHNLPRAGDTAEFCVVGVTIRSDGHMVVDVSWTVHLVTKSFIWKFPDKGNRNMYMTDNLGNRYDHVSVGGSAAVLTAIPDGQTVIGWFEFPKAHEGARYFTFYDDDQNINISGMSFESRFVARGTVGLLWYPFSVEYMLELWEPGTAEDGSATFANTGIDGCQLLEMQPSEPEGTYLNTITLGDITYDIYGWYESDWSVREYLAIEGPGLEDANALPLFQAIIPYDDSLNCIFDFSEVLSTLRPKE